MGSFTTGGKSLTVALWYASWGWPVFPLVPGPTKAPVAGTHGHNDASTDAATVEEMWHRAWFTVGSDVGIGVRCAGRAGFTVDLDVKDTKNGISEFGQLLARETGTIDYPAEWLTFRTRSGGRHVIFESPRDGRDVHTGRDVLGPGIDLRGPRGYRAVYDPENPTGYSFLQGHPREDGSYWITPAPAWLLADERLYAPVRVLDGDGPGVELPEGEMCTAVRAAAQLSRWDFEDHHGTATRVMHLVKLAAEGHTGVLEALVLLQPFYIEGRDAKSARDGNPRNPEDDFERMVAGALQREPAPATPKPDPCTERATRLRRLAL